MLKPRCSASARSSSMIAKPRIYYKMFLNVTFRFLVTSSLSLVRGLSFMLCPLSNATPLLVRANAATSPSQALTHSEMLSQISTFLAAGHETTASALTWTLYALARAPAAQTRLRAALHTCDTSNSQAVLELALLEHTVREALRLHAPVSGTMRVYAGKTSECFVPLQYPVRVRVSTWHRLSHRLRNCFRPSSCEKESSPWVLQNGIYLRHGDIINIPIQAVNHATDLWGPDARDFRPERWAALPSAVTTIPGLYAHTLTFLNGNGGATGNRSCIGYRFALAEIKMFLACLLRDLEFSIDDNVVIEKRIKCVFFLCCWTGLLNSKMIVAL